MHMLSCLRYQELNGVWFNVIMTINCVLLIIEQHCQIVVGYNKITIKSITSPGKKSCVGKEKLTVAKNFISTLRNHTSYKISGNYLTFYNGSIARLVFAKIISDGEESTIIKRSYKVDPVYYNKGGRKYLKLHDFVSQTN